MKTKKVDFTKTISEKVIEYPDLNAYQHKQLVMYYEHRFTKFESACIKKMEKSFSLNEFGLIDIEEAIEIINQTAKEFTT